MNFFEKDDRPKIAAFPNYVLFRFFNQNNKVTLQYAFEEQDDDWKTLYSFTPEDYLILCCSKFTHKELETFGLILTENDIQVKEDLIVRTSSPTMEITNG